MNQPDRYERVEYCVDTKLANAATFVIQREDHTVGNVIRMKLHEDTRVWFAGYKIPHPLEHRLLIKVRTNGMSTPMAVYNAAIDDSVQELQALKNEFRRQVQEMCDAEGVKADFEPHERIGGGAGAYDAAYDTGEPYNEAADMGWDAGYGGPGQGYAPMDTGASAAGAYGS